MKKILSSKTGFTLLEVMIAGSILLGLSLAGMQMMRNQSMSTNVVQMQNEEERLIDVIHSLLANSTNCEATLQNKDIGRVTNPSEFYPDPSMPPPNGINGQDTLDEATDAIYVVPTGGGAAVPMFQRKDATVSGTHSSVKRFGNKGLVITNYYLDSTTPTLRKFFGIDNNSNTSTLKFAALRVYFHRDIDNKNDILASDIMLKMVPLVINTQTAAGDLVDTCRATGGSDSVWGVHTTQNDIYFNKGRVSIGTEKVLTADDDPWLQVYGAMDVRGNINVEDMANVKDIVVKEKLVIPATAPATPSRGSLWIE